MVDPSINERGNKPDRLQLVALAGLMCLGAAFVFSATMANESAVALPWFKQTWVHQIVWYALGLGAGAAHLPGGLSHAGALVVRGLLGDDSLPGRRFDSAHWFDAATARGAGLICAFSNSSRASLRNSRSSSRRRIF